MLIMRLFYLSDCLLLWYILMFFFRIILIIKLKAVSLRYDYALGDVCPIASKLLDNGHADP